MLPVLKWMKAPLSTVIFNMPSEDGVNITYFDGNETYDYSVLLGSWGQSITIEQLSGEAYATLVPEDGVIYTGNENGNIDGGGTATFKVGFESAVSDLFTLVGRDTFDINVSLSDEERTINTVEEFLSIRKNPRENILSEPISISPVLSSTVSATMVAAHSRAHSTVQVTLSRTSTSHSLRATTMVSSARLQALPSRMWHSLSSPSTVARVSTM